jgi:hypothetical protein
MYYPWGYPMNFSVDFQGDFAGTSCCYSHFRDEDTEVKEIKQPN